MTVTLTGDNHFLLRSALKERTAEAAKDYGDLGYQQIDCSEAEIQVILQALTSLPFLSPRKLVVLRQVSASADLSQKLPELIAQLPETTDLIVVEEQIDKRTSLYKFLSSKTDFKEFKTLDPNALAAWVISSAKDKGSTINSHDARYLIERAGNDQERLNNELNKLVLYGSSINQSSIDLLVQASPSSSIFDLLEAAFSGNRKRVIDLYNEQRRLKVEPQQIISMITWQLHILMIVKTAKGLPADKVATDAGLNPFVVMRSLNIASKLTLGHIAQLVDKLLKLDIASKSKSIDLDDGLIHYLLSI